MSDETPTAEGFVDPRVLLRRYELRPKRSFGQNFLVSERVVQKIAELCTADSPQVVVEIGAGLGTLTSALLARAPRVVAIERDRDLLPVLEKEFEGAITRGGLRLVEADAAQVDFRELFGDAERVVLAGNLPYQITGRLIERATELGTRVQRLVVMVQREVADRLIAPPDGDSYGQLSIFAQAGFTVKRELLVSAGCFHPRPEVESAVVSFTPLATPRAEETPTFRRVVHAAFAARRKTLRNALAALLGEPGAKDAVATTGIDLQRRGETLSVEELAAIARALDVARTGEANT